MSESLPVRIEGTNQLGDPIVIGTPESGWASGLSELRSTIWLDGKSQDIWFRSDLPQSQVADGVEPFLSVCLLPAMRTGRNLKTDAPVSPLFMDHQRLIQNQFRAWDSTLQVIEVQAPLRALDVASEGRPTATFFSGGVDSFHTTLTHRAEIDDLIFVHGFDISIENSQLYRMAYERILRVADTLGKTLVRVETNLRAFTDALSEWGRYQHGPALGAVAQWLASRYRRIFIPGENFPDEPSAWFRGSQPRTDPFFSTERVTVVHDGYLPTRNRKIRAMIDEPCVRESLRVCWENPGGAYNCGRCSKCLRNMAVIRACGCLDRFITFPPELDLEALARVNLEPGEWRMLFEETLAQVARDRRDPALEQALRLCLARHRRRLWRLRLARWFHPGVRRRK
jgi:hypothetical protein